MTFLANAQAPRWCPAIPLCTLDKVWVASYFSKHFRKGVGNPLIYIIPSIKEYKLSLLFMRLVFIGTERSLPCSICLAIGAIEEVHSLFLIFFVTILEAYILGLLRVS